MAVIEGATSGLELEVGLAAAQAAHVTVKPIPHGSLGHYRSNHRTVLVNSQGANTRLFEMRNASSTNLIIPTRLVIKWLQTANHTAAIEDSIDVYKVTSFTAVSTVNTATPGTSVKRATGMAGSPGAIIRGLTAAGNASGMTTTFAGTKDGTSIGQLPQWLLAAIPTAGVIGVQLIDNFDDVNGTHPFVFGQNEGFLIENRVALGAAAGSSLYIDFSWCETTAY